MSRHVDRCLGMSLTINAILLSAASAGPLLIGGAHEYNPVADIGYTPQSGLIVNNSGVAFGSERLYLPSSSGVRGLRFGPASGTAVELGHLGLNPNGEPYSDIATVNSNGTAAGTSWKYVNGIAKGDRPVVWLPGETAITELQTLGTDSNGYTRAWVLDMNESGALAGCSYKYINNVEIGQRAVRWNSIAAVPIELGILPESGTPTHSTRASEINSSGQIFGTVARGDDNRPVRWDPSSINPIPLGLLGLNAEGETRHCLKT